MEINHHPSFGWHYPMHKEIIIPTLKKTNISKAIEDGLKAAVQKPDLEEFFLYGQSHFYYPNDIIKSYLDITGTHNAKKAYYKHLKKLDNALAKDDIKTATDEAGRALHYLHDMTQPNHIESGSIIKKARDKKMHADFEMAAFAIQDKHIGNAIPVKLESNDFQELFNDTLSFSMKNDKPNNSNREKWNDIAQRGIDIATGVTERFIELFQEKIK